MILSPAWTSTSVTVTTVDVTVTLLVPTLMELEDALARLDTVGTGSPVPTLTSANWGQVRAILLSVSVTIQTEVSPVAVTMDTLKVQLAPVRMLTNVERSQTAQNTALALTIQAGSDVLATLDSPAMGTLAQTSTNVKT